jgi:hypothetical protein
VFICLHVAEDLADASDALVDEIVGDAAIGQPDLCLSS